MKLKGSLALLVVFTLLMTSIVCSAAPAVNTTATYGDSGFSVTTTATGLEEGSMVAYAIYGPGSFDKGEITNGTDSAITVGTDGSTNIKYIDQQTVSNGSVTFTTTANSSALANFAGAKVKLGSSSDADQAVLASTSSVIDNSVATYTIKVNAWDPNLAYIQVDVLGANPYTVYLTESNLSVKILEGVNLKFTFAPKMGYKLGDSGYSLGIYDINVNSTNTTATYEVGNSMKNGNEYGMTLGTCTSRADTTKWVSVNNYTVNDNELMVLMNNQTESTVGVNVVVKDGDTVVATVEGLSVLDDSNAAIGGYCGIILKDSALVNSSYTYDIQPYYVGSEGNVALTNGVTADGITTYSVQ